MSTHKHTAHELKALRRQIDKLNRSRTDLFLFSYMTEEQNLEMQDIIDALEDRFIALTNEANA